MANILPLEKQVIIVSALAEGNSIRSIERMTGIHRDTVMRLGVRVGKACERLLDEQMRNLDCHEIQVDEIWGFIGKKQKLVPEACYGDLNQGDVWTFVALDPETKLVPSFICGKRDFEHTQRFSLDLAARMKNRIQLSSDGMNQYMATVEEAFGDDVDYGQIVKTYASEAQDGVGNARRYSPPPIVGVRKTIICGMPDEETISTSHVERQNLTMRMHVRRLTRLTNAFSKKFDNFRAAVSLHFAYYNFAKIHSGLRCTPSMAAGVTSSLWKVEDLVQLAS